MLHDFLLKERAGILALCARKILTVSGAAGSSVEMEKGLPVLYDELIEVLRTDLDRSESQALPSQEQQSSAARRGKESLKLGYSISQIVHGYGAISAAISQYLSEMSASVSSYEMNLLNHSLDTATAQAVSEFDRLQREGVARDEVQRLGFLAHELRNALSTATIAYRMMQSGNLGVGGNTSRILENAHSRMKDLIDRSLTEVRLKSEHPLQLKRCAVLQLVGDVEVTALSEAAAKSITIGIAIPVDLEIMADPHLIISAISNLVHNAIKFTKHGGTVSIRGKASLERASIEVEDQCGGLPAGKEEELFIPFSQMREDKSGMGLGLTIARRAILLNHGTLGVRNIPGEGCVFTIDLPLATPLR